jgi:hypothetical protein
MDFLNKKYSEEEIRKTISQLFKDDWNYISCYQILSEDFIKEFKNKINWNYISCYQKLSENFIREFQDKVHWGLISEYQILSEDFIKEFKNKVNWNYISRYQTLSENFIREFKNKIDWYYISINENLQLSNKFCEEFDKKLGLYNVWLINGKYHRTLGPAYGNEFWYRGEKIEVSNMKQYKRWLKLRIFS